jgi:hypothetical protein
MLYRKNVYAWEQIARFIAGGGMIVAAILLIWDSIWGYGLIAAGIYTALTGVFGYCPACAMIGRNPLDDKP